MNIEMEYENTEITKKQELRKVEIEKDIVEDNLNNKQEMLRNCELQRQYWISRFEEESQSHLATIAQLNNLKVVIEDLKAAKDKLESDIKQLDKNHKVSSTIAKEREDKHNKCLKENEMLKIKYDGCQKALENVEYHHKNYIIRLRKEHKKIISERDNMYNHSTMEQEDIYMRAAKYYEEKMENEKIIKTFKAHTKMFKEQAKKAKKDLETYKIKYDKGMSQLNTFRTENERLENDVARKNDEIIDLTDKRLKLYFEKEKYRDKFIGNNAEEIIKELEAEQVKSVLFRCLIR